LIVWSYPIRVIGTFSQLRYADKQR
jgi:hypothetical protein